MKKPSCAIALTVGYYAVYYLGCALEVEDPRARRSFDPVEYPEGSASQTLRNFDNVLLDFIPASAAPFPLAKLGPRFVKVRLLRRLAVESS